jgi:osmotically-inducible protein OsmY
MNRNGFILAALSAASSLGLAACDFSQHVDPGVEAHPSIAWADPDQALADKVKKALGFDAQPGIYGIEVTAANGTVQLWGTVESSAKRKRIEVTTAGVVGVRAVDSRLAVDPGA